MTYQNLIDQLLNLPVTGDYLNQDVIVYLGNGESNPLPYLEIVEKGTDCPVASKDNQLYLSVEPF